MLFIKKASILFFLALIIISCSSTPLPRNSSVDVPDDFLGIVHAGSTNTKEEYQMLDELGVKWLLRTFYWSAIENEKGKFDFSRYDTFVDIARQEGKKIAITLGYETPWLFPNGKAKRYISPENIPHFLNYVEETVRHYKGRVDAWQIWNEPNHPWFWKGSKKEFFELTRLTALKIRETDPDVFIIGGAFVRSPRGFTKAMNKAGAMENLDGLSFHPYAMNPSGAIRLHNKFINILSEINFSGDVWITEAGHPTGGWYPTRVSLEKFPSYVVKTIAGAAVREPRVLLWYQMFDHYNEGEVSRLTESAESFFGLVYPNYQRKDAAWAFELCASFLPGSRYASDYPVREKISKGIVSMCFLKGTSGNNTLIVWNDNIFSKKIKLYVSDPAFLYDISTGNKTSLQEETVLNVGKTPMFITWQGEAIPRLSAAP